MQERKWAVTDARAQTQRDNAFDQRSLARVAAALAGLPAVATQDWVDQAASTLAGMDPCCRVGIAIAQAEPTGQIRSVEAVGVHASAQELERVSDPKAELLGMQVRLERLTDLGLAVPANGLSQGLAAAAEDLGNWREGPLGRVWNPSGIERLLIGVVPIGKDPLDRLLLVFVALGPAATGVARASARTLGALIPLLARRAWRAVPATGPVSWLTDREQDVLDRLILGRSVREIAEEMGRSPHTVHDHVKSLHRKLDASSRGELVARALGHGSETRADIEPIVIERVRAAAQIEPMPAAGAARRG
jgi:DNA-binding CsgD family transcriptional regulator